MKRIHKENGFTLIEVIVALAILGLIAVIFISMFSTGYTGILKAGHKSKAGYTIQQAIENNIAGSAAALPANVTILPNVANILNINLSNGTSFSVAGNDMTFKFDDTKTVVSILLFKPN